jgi:5'-3' exoribonuclease 2
MGVPSFAAWIFKQFGGFEPLYTMVDEVEGKNKVKCDNFYIDMNGLIHPCAHPEVGKKPETEEEIIENVLKYLDRILNAAEPTNLLYMAIGKIILNLIHQMVLLHVQK